MHETVSTFPFRNPEGNWLNSLTQEPWAAMTPGGGGEQTRVSGDEHPLLFAGLR